MMYSEEHEAIIEIEESEDGERTVGVYTKDRSEEYTLGNSHSLSIRVAAGADTEASPHTAMLRPTIEKVDVHQSMEDHIGGGE